LTAASAGDDKPPASDDAAIKAVVAHFAKNGVSLAKEKEGNYWVVTDPKGDGYDVLVAWRTFPTKATEEEMQTELKMINLGFLLNAPARVAMSKPGLRSADLVNKPPPLDQVPVVAKLEKLFKEYKPQNRKSNPARFLTASSECSLLAAHQRPNVFMAEKSSGRISDEDRCSAKSNSLKA